MPFDRLTEILQEVKAIGDLPCLRGSFARALGIEPGAIAAYDLDRGMVPEPRRGRRRGAIRKNVDDLSPLEINHHRSVVRYPSSMPNRRRRRL